MVCIHEAASSNLARSTISSFALKFLGFSPQQVPSFKTDIVIAKPVEVDSVELDSDLSLRKARRFGIIFLIYTIVLPFIVLLIPEDEFPASTGPIEAFSWLMLFLMPIELLLLYISYRHFRKKPELSNIMGPAILMYTFAVIPSIYAFVIGFIGSNLRGIAIPLGLALSLIGFWFVWMFLPNLQENITRSDDY